MCKLCITYYILYIYTLRHTPIRLLLHGTAAQSMHARARAGLLRIIYRSRTIAQRAVARALVLRARARAFCARRHARVQNIEYETWHLMWRIVYTAKPTRADIVSAYILYLPTHNTFVSILSHVCGVLCVCLTGPTRHTTSTTSLRFVRVGLEQRRRGSDRHFVGRLHNGAHQQPREKNIRRAYFLD